MVGVDLAKKKLKDEDRCIAKDAKGRRCPKPIHIKKMKLCSAHYQQVYHHGEVTNNPRGRQSELKKKAKKYYQNYRGRDAMRDIKQTLINEGEDPDKVRKVVWAVVRGSKSAGSS